MLAFQLIAASAILARGVIAEGLPLEPAFAFFLALAILAAAGFARLAAVPRISLLALKMAVCAAALPYSSLPLWLAPALCMEPLAIAGNASRALAIAVGAAGAAISASAALALPIGLMPPYLGLCALSAYAAAAGLRAAREREALGSRARELEVGLARAEARGATLERNGVGQELLIQLEERDRVARALHDELGHTITGGIMQLEAASLLARDEPERAAASIDKASRTLKEGLAAIRASLRGIQPEPSALGLRKIQTMLDRFAADYGREATLRARGELGAMPAALWRVIEANLREALTNTLKHSDGRRFSLAIEAMPGVYKVEYLDDGSRRGPIASGMGLEGMEARAREAGGAMIVDTTRGFSVIMLFKRGRSGDADTDSDRR